ncbi:sialate O-acetylesterase [Salmonella enterica]|nr:sialate O-acetylesterase [Salmonella enterica]EEM7113056.1 sialate O-acetylesterase [Salmonella enterica subsp. enterica serovar Poona]HBI5521418.1 sialate O-acetylesterase [Salmonella enterica subsp. enterica serovar Welikade]EAS9889849.1 sialate O-acetylesterase [Salmonella enterica]EEG2844283.1 sialate O-acetylesterase [Salmonella enterica]
MPGEAQASHPMTNRQFTAGPPQHIWIRSAWYEGNVRVIVSPRARVTVQLDSTVFGSGAAPAISSEPEYWYVILVAGQSNAMAYGEGLPLPATLDKTHPRIKQLARRATVTPGGEACAYNDIIPLDHCPHDVQDMSRLSHPRADLSKGEYGCVSQALHIAKKLLAYIPDNAGILMVPCARGGSAFTQGGDGAFDVARGATESSSRWGAGKPLYQDLIARTKAALDKNPKNVLLAVVWMQGEFDMSGANYAQQPALFAAMVRQFRTDMTSHTAQMPDFSPFSVPWICGDTTHYWKEKYPVQYDTIYGAYKNSPEPGVYFVPFMTDENGVNTPTNAPADDPDIAAAHYFGSASRSSGNWTSSLRDSHFSSPARRGIVAERLAAAILLHAGRGTLLAAPVAAAPLSHPENPVPTLAGGTQNYAPQVETFGYNGRRGDGTLQAQGWQTATGGTFTTVEQTDGSSGHLLQVGKQAGKAWNISQTVTHPADLLRYGGRLRMKFKITGTGLVNNRFAFGFYLNVNTADMPAGVFPGGGGRDTAMAFFIQTDAANTNLMWHGRANRKVGSFGAFSNDWQTLEIEYPGNNSLAVTPYFNGTKGTPFIIEKTAGSVSANTLSIQSVTASETYDVAFEYFSVDIFRDEGIVTLAEDDAASYVWFPPGLRGGRVILPDTKVSAGNTVQIVASGTGKITVVPGGGDVLINGASRAATATDSVTLVQAGSDGKSWQTASGTLTPAFVVPPALLAKLTAVTGLGTRTALGTVLETQTAARHIIDVVNTYLSTPLTEQEMRFILDNVAHFTFTLMVGDRRSEQASRIISVGNWHGEDVTSFATGDLEQPYNLKLTWNASVGTMILTDHHSGRDNTFGAIRGLTITPKD